MLNEQTSWGLEESEGRRLEFATRGRMEREWVMDRSRGLGEVDW